jgi:hypothetical protein
VLWSRGRRLSASSLAASSDGGAAKATVNLGRETAWYPRGPFGVVEIALPWPGAGMVEMVPGFDCAELSTPMEIAGEEMGVTTLAFAVGLAPTTGLDRACAEAAVATMAFEEVETVSVARLLHALPPALDTRHLKTWLLSAEETSGRLYVAEAAPWTALHEEPAFVLVIHWYSVPDPLARMLKVADPPDVTD